MNIFEKYIPNGIYFSENLIFYVMSAICKAAHPHFEVYFGINILQNGFLDALRFVCLHFSLGDNFIDSSLYSCGHHCFGVTSGIYDLSLF